MIDERCGGTGVRRRGYGSKGACHDVPFVRGAVDRVVAIWRDGGVSFELISDFQEIFKYTRRGIFISIFSLDESNLISRIIFLRTSARISEFSINLFC
jgi:hypothetical protein